MANRNIKFCDECDLWDPEENGEFWCPNLKFWADSKSYAETDNPKCEHYQEDEN